MLSMKVKDLILQDLDFGIKMDQQMADSVEMAEGALKMEAHEGYPVLAEAIKKAGNCFEQWGLTGKLLPFTSNG